MEMTVGEIKTSYRLADNKKQQIEILSQLNACSEEDIVKILRDGGVDVPFAEFPQDIETEFEEIPEIEDEYDEEPIDEGINEEEDLENVKVVGLYDQSMLTDDEAYSVAEFIDSNLLDAIRNDVDWDSVQALRNIIHAYEKLCKRSGYVGLTDDC